MWRRPDNVYGDIYIYIYIYIYQIVVERALKSFHKCAVILWPPHNLYPLELSSSSGRSRCPDGGFGMF